MKDKPDVPKGLPWFKGGNSNSVKNLSIFL